MLKGMHSMDNSISIWSVNDWPLRATQTTLTLAHKHSRMFKLLIYHVFISGDWYGAH